MRIVTVNNKCSRKAVVISLSLAFFSILLGSNPVAAMPVNAMSDAPSERELLEQDCQKLAIAEGKQCAAIVGKLLESEFVLPMVHSKNHKDSWWLVSVQSGDYAAPLRTSFDWKKPYPEGTHQILSEAKDYVGFCSCPEPTKGNSGVRGYTSTLRTINYE